MRNLLPGPLVRTGNDAHDAPGNRRAGSRVALVALVAALVSALTGCGIPQSAASRIALHVTQVRAVPLPGDSSRFDYESLDSSRGLLFIAHLGASQIIEVNVRTGRVVRTINNIADVHGVLVVPALERVYATATGSNQLVAIDEASGTELGRAPTGDYPDGLASTRTTTPSGPPTRTAAARPSSTSTP
jgi:hypothetical protein